MCLSTILVLLDTRKMSQKGPEGLRGNSRH